MSILAGIEAALDSGLQIDQNWKLPRRADNEAHEARARFVAQPGEIEMLGRIVKTIDLTMPEQRARNAEHDRRLKVIFAED